MPRNPGHRQPRRPISRMCRQSASHPDRETRIAMYETTPVETDDEATRALQAALDRRDNGGPTGH
ncbi:hypothetical protein Nans01_10000 [Nocardiopsis ansamitocini]|uniref:Uncharacterized protein n=1 Tax=Nocardiopsis ansamitocini TaxID=1670832 RepID=A0A9W6P3K9_9ACTN|nr:hypothetical protein Nans01_10000 [Nocardiopsis ansamitocini]